MAVHGTVGKRQKGYRKSNKPLHFCESDRNKGLFFYNTLKLHLPFSVRDGAQLPGPVEALEHGGAFGLPPSSGTAVILSLCWSAARANAV